MPLKVVLDTNCLISTLVFAKGKLGWLKYAWQDGLFLPLVCHKTVMELLRVLGYSKFSLNSDSINKLLEDFLPYAVMVEGVEDDCIHGLRDNDDSIFVNLAVKGQASCLVTGDVHLLEIADSVSGFMIVRPAEFMDMLLGS